MGHQIEKNLYYIFSHLFFFSFYFPAKLRKKNQMSCEYIVKIIANGEIFLIMIKFLQL